MLLLGAGRWAVRRDITQRPGLLHHSLHGASGVACTHHELRYRPQEFNSVCFG